MQVESITRKTLGLKSHRVLRASYFGGRYEIELDRIQGRRLPCSCCKRPSPVRDRLKRRSWAHAMLWGDPVTLWYAPARVMCIACGVKVEDIPWSIGKCRLSQPLIVAVAGWTRLLAWDVVARMYGVAWGTIRAAVNAVVSYGLAHRDVSNVTLLGIDEISRGRGIFHSQVYDLVDKRLLWSGEGRDEKALRRFFAECTGLRPTIIVAVCCDMWQPYVKVIQEVLPTAIVVFDKFHLVRHLLEAVNDVRKAEARELKRTNPELLTGTRYVWLKNPWNLTRAQRTRLRELEWYNLKINRAYLLKELFRHVWDFTTRGGAKRYLDSWFQWATHSRLEPIRKFAWLVRRHETGILARFDTPIDIGSVEAMNNNAKAIAHRSRGFRTEKTFSLAQLHTLGKLPLPPTTHRFL